MKKAPVFMLCAAFLLAFFLLAPGLISGPEDGETGEPEHVQSAVFYAARIPEAETQSTPEAREQRAQRGEALDLREAAAAVPVCMCDRNGMPLNDRTWQKTVYIVCPPEGVPG